MKKIDKQTLNKVLIGLPDNNMRFSDWGKLILSSGFDEQIKGDNHIFTKDDLAGIINHTAP